MLVTVHQLQPFVELLVELRRSQPFAIDRIWHLHHGVDVPSAQRAAFGDCLFLNTNMGRLAVTAIAAAMCVNSLGKKTLSSCLRYSLRPQSAISGSDIVVPFADNADNVRMGAKPSTEAPPQN